MTLRRRFLAALLLPLLLISGSLPAADAAREIGLVHVNDVYQVAPIDPKAPRGGLARLATLVAGLRRTAPETLLVFGGDTLSPSVESGLFAGRQMISAWNALGLALAVLGNHEFDFGEAVLRERLAESKFPWLAANLVATPPLPAVRASELRMLGGVAVGFVGLLTPDTATLSKPGPQIRFAALEPAARREAERLRALGAEVLIALTHNSLAEDRELAASGLFDLILGGHDHHRVTETVGRTPILKAGSDARDAIHVRIRVEGSVAPRRVAGIAWDLIPVDGRFAEDPAVLAAAAPFAGEADRRLGEAIGVSRVALDARGSTLRQEESNLANFVADAVRAAMGAEVALLNGGGFRADRILGPGPLTRRDVLSLLPFRNPLLLLEIDGDTLRRVLEHGVEQRLAHGESGAMPQVSGMRLHVDPKAAKGARVDRIEIGGRPLDPARRYTLATSQYLAGGGDGYVLLRSLPVLRPAEGSPIETEVAIDAILAAGTIAPAVEGRMEIGR